MNGTTLVFMLLTLVAVGSAVWLRHDRDEWRNRAEIAEAVNIANRKNGNAKDTVNQWGKFLLSDMVDDLRERQKEAVRLMDAGDFYEARQVLTGEDENA